MIAGKELIFMKRTISILLSLALLLGLLSACAQSAVEQEPPAEEPEAVIAAKDLAETVLPASGRDEALEIERLNTDEDGSRLGTYIEAICGLTGEQWEDAAVIRGMGASAFEIVVLRLGDEEAAESTKAVLTDYLTVREGAFTGYAPDEAEMASNGKVRREGRTVGLFICPDPAGAGAMFSAACNEEELPALPEPVEEPDDFTPVAETRDILFRLLLDAAYPELPEHSGPSDDFGWIDSDEGLTYEFSGLSAGQYKEYVAAIWDFYTCGDESWWSRYALIFLADSEEGASGLIQDMEDYRTSCLDTLRAIADASDEKAAEVLTVWENAQLVQAGRYAALIATERSAEGALLFPRIISDPSTQGANERWRLSLKNQTQQDTDPDYPDRVRFTPPEEEDMSIYDTSAILAAWEAGDPNRLSGDDAAVYEAARAVLAEMMRDGMTDLEKETAAYRWMVNNVNYDWSHMDALEETDRRAYGPYGGLVDRAAVCLGYAASFQLLMDMSGVECITVVGAAFNSTGDHAWNMVRLNGQWYCVDPTWDANARELSGEEQEWRYFNLTSDEMAKNHQWDYANTPEATSEDRGGAA